MAFRVRHRFLQPLVSARATGAHQRRGLTDQGGTTGTGTLPAHLLKAIQEDLEEEELRRTGGLGETVRKCVPQGVLDHLESPEADAAHLQRVDTMIENLFSKMPLPEDPMKSALAPTDEELQERKENELLKEIVREQYLRQNASKAAEEERIKKAMRSYDAEGEPASSKQNVPKEKEDSIDKVEIRRQLDEMKRQMERLEKLLDVKPR